MKTVISPRLYLQATTAGSKFGLKVSDYLTLFSRAPPSLDERWNAVNTFFLSNPKTMMVFCCSFLRISASCSTAWMVEIFLSIVIKRTRFPRLRTSLVLKSFGGYLKFFFKDWAYLRLENKKCILLEGIFYFIVCWN